MTWQKQVGNGQQVDDGRVASLLRQVAEHVPGDIDLRPRVQQRLAASQHRRSIRTSRSTRARSMTGLTQRQFVPRWGYLMGSVIVIVGLLLSAFAFARPLIFSWLGDNGLRGISLDNASLINQSATHQGVTLHLEQGYADAARTALTMRIQVPQGHNMVTPRLDTAYLLDSRGQRYAVLIGQQVGDEGLLEFVPLPIEALSSAQRLTLVVQAMLPNGPVAGGSPLSGPWQIPFEVHPQTAHSTMLAAPPMTQSGVTLQPERLDMTPAGARLVVRVSGLAADTSFLDATHFAQHGGDTIVGCPPNSGSCVTSGSTSDGALLRLESADGQILEPSWVLAMDPATPDLGVIPTARQTVGPSGTVEIEILFFTPLPLHAAPGTVQLTIDHFPLKSSHVDASGKVQMASGPWTFALMVP